MSRHADNQRRVLATRVECKHALMRFVRAACRAQAVADAPFDRRRVRSKTAECGSDLIMGLGVGGIVPKPRFAERQRPANVTVEFVGEFGSRRTTPMARFCLSEIILDADGALLEDDLGP